MITTTVSSVCRRQLVTQGLTIGWPSHRDDRDRMLINTAQICRGPGLRLVVQKKRLEKKEEARRAPVLAIPVSVAPSKMIPPLHSLVKYDQPVLVSTTKGKKPTGKTKVRERRQTRHLTQRPILPGKNIPTHRECCLRGHLNWEQPRVLFPSGFFFVMSKGVRGDRGLGRGKLAPGFGCEPGSSRGETGQGIGGGRRWNSYAECSSAISNRVLLFFFFSVCARGVNLALGGEAKEMGTGVCPGVRARASCVRPRPPAERGDRCRDPEPMDGSRPRECRVPALVGSSHSTRGCNQPNHVEKLSLDKKSNSRREGVQTQ